MEKKQLSLLVLMAVVAGTLGAMVWFAMAKPGAEQQAFSAQGITNLDSLVLRGNLTAGGNVIASGKVKAGTWGQFTRASVITVTNGGTIAPGGSYQPLVATAAAGAALTVTAGMQQGFVTVLVNESSNTITITDTDPGKLASNVALGQYDSIVLICDGTNWIELARSNN
jgi:Flp pilus assembly protein CpaB